MTDALTRWRDGWEGTNQVVVVGRGEQPVAEETRAVLEGAGLEIVPSPLKNERGELAEAVANAEVLISGGNPMGPAEFAGLTKARFVLRPYVGYDDIDVDAATEQGILFANVPDTFVEEVSNHALALILADNRRLMKMDRFVRDGRWFAGENPRQVAYPMRRLSTMTLGLVGFGGIARLVAQRAAPFGFRILAHDPFVAPDAGTSYGVTLVSMDELLGESDIVSVHVLLNKQTRHLIDAGCFAKMKPTAVLINTARGPVVDEQALIQALQSGQIAAAALDVQEQEPLDPASPLNTMENVLLAPHLASYSDEGDILHRHRVGQLALEAASGGLPERKVLVNKPLYDQIVTLPEMTSVKRY